MDKFTIENLELYYGDFKALKGINMHIPKMRYLHLLGPPAVESQLF